MRCRRCIRALTTAAAVAVALAVPSGHVRAASSTCGNDGDPACPVVSRVVPDVVTAPVQDATITITGSNLAGVAQVILQPGGRSLRIGAKTDTSLVVDLPNGLAAGGYQVELGIQDQTQNLIITPHFQVSSDAAGGGTLPHFTFAPPPPPGQPAAAAPAPAPALAAHPTSPPLPGQILHGALVALLVAGMGLVVLVAGSIYGTYWRARRLRNLPYAALDRKLAEIWAHGEQHVLPVAARPTRDSPQPFTPVVRTPSDDREVTAPRY